MKPRYLFLFFIAFLLMGSGLRAQVDSTARARVDSVSKAVDTVKRHQAATDAQTRRLDSATTAAIDSSFSQALARARQYPKELYNQPKSGLVSFFGFAILALFTGFSLYLFATSAICRNDSYMDDCRLKPTSKRSYSYSRVQLFWWTLIILFCYIWFFARFNLLLPLNPTVVILLGSTLAVYIFGKTMDNSQISRNNRQEPTRHQDINDSKGFLIDILSDDNGVSIHRLQALAFNVIYGLGFLSFFFMKIATKNAYPFIDFEPWQFSLLGVSAIGYLGLKANENPTTTIGNRMAEKEKEKGVRSSSSNEVSRSEEEAPAARRINEDD